MAKLIGRYYFKQTSNGNLIGEFSCNLFHKIYTESADFKEGKRSKVPFIGSYFSTWEDEGNSIMADLDIDYKYKQKITIYKLTWKLKGNLTYVGEGMLCDNILIGDYSEV